MRGAAAADPRVCDHAHMDGPSRRAARATAVAALLLVALAAAGLVRSRPQGGGSRPAGLDVAGLLAVLERTALVFAVVALAALVGLLLEALRSGQMPAREPDSQALLRRTLGMVLILYVVAAVASRVLPRLLATAGAAGPAADAGEAVGPASGIDAVLWPVAALLAVAAVSLVVVWFLRSHREAPDVGAQVGATTAAAVRRLDAGEPVGDVVLDAYRRLERRLAEVGVVRGSAETSTELLVRALADVDVDPDAVRRLGNLYEQVRFGGHVAGEADRSEARAALVAVSRMRAGASRGAREADVDA